MKLKEKPNDKQVNIVLSFIQRNCSGRRLGAGKSTEMVEYRAEKVIYPKFVEFEKDRLGGLMLLSPLIKDRHAAEIAAYNLAKPKGSPVGLHNKVANIKKRLAILDEYLNKLKGAA